MIQTKKELEVATFGAGCFWGVEEVFYNTKGVKSTNVGFMGGTVKNPSYELVCMGNTGHAEVVQLKYNLKEVSYKDLLRIFWKIHNPTTKNKQGPDIGNQYRSVIFYHTPEQKSLAEKSKKELEKSAKYKKPIVTEIKPAKPFYEAEEYHQKYFQKQGGSCHV
jgi:peptide-methionine (S)-S-oxide reductase